MSFSLSQGTLRASKKKRLAETWGRNNSSTVPWFLWRRSETRGKSSSVVLNHTGEVVYRGVVQKDYLMMMVARVVFIKSYDSIAGSYWTIRIPYIECHGSSAFVSHCTFFLFRKRSGKMMIRYFFWWSFFSFTKRSRTSGQVESTKWWFENGNRAAAKRICKGLHYTWY